MSTGALLHERLTGAPAMLWVYVWVECLAFVWLVGQSLVLGAGFLPVVSLAAVAAACWTALAYFLLVGNRVAHVVALVGAARWAVTVSALGGRWSVVVLYLLLGPVALVSLCLPSVRRYVWGQPRPA